MQGELGAKGIGCGVYYPVSLHLQDCFKQQGGKPGDLPVCEQLCNEVLSLPVFDQMTNAQIDEAADAVIAALE